MLEYAKVTLAEETDSYGRWEGQFYTIQRFRFRGNGFEHKKVEPYYTVYSLRDYSRFIGEAATLEQAKQIAEKDNAENY